MPEIDAIIEDIREALEVKNKAREDALSISRTVIRLSSYAIRAIHRHDWEKSQEQLAASRKSAMELIQATENHPDLYYSGYTQDALKEYVEAFITFALVKDTPLPTPGSLRVPPATYVNGLAEAASELRRHILDIIRPGHAENAEQLLEWMDTIYSYLIAIDFPDAITGGLRRRADSLRAVLERTRGDVTTSIRQQRLQSALEALYEKAVLNEETPTEVFTFDDDPLED